MLVFGSNLLCFELADTIKRGTFPQSLNMLGPAIVILAKGELGGSETGWVLGWLTLHLKTFALLRI